MLLSINVCLGQCLCQSWYVSMFVWVSACVSVGMYQCLSGSVSVRLSVCLGEVLVSINVCLGECLFGSVLVSINVCLC